MAKRPTGNRSTGASTPPKGRPTRKRDLRPPSRNGRAIAGWLLVILLVAVLIGVAIYIGSSQEVRIPGTAPAELRPVLAADPVAADPVTVLPVVAGPVPSPTVPAG